LTGTVTEQQPGTGSVATGDVTVGDIWEGLATFLNDHWVPTLPGASASVGPVTFQMLGDNLSIDFSDTLTINDTVNFDASLGADFGDLGLSLTAGASVPFTLSTGLGFGIDIDIGSGDVDFVFDELFVTGTLQTSNLNLGLSLATPLGEIGLNTGSPPQGVVDLRIGGSVTFDETTGFEFSATERKDGTPISNSVQIYLPLFLAVGGDGVALGSISFGDTDFFDGNLDPGFSADLREIGGVLDDVALLALNALADEVIDIRGDLVPTFYSEGN
jgi:hypothetical protein